MVKGASTCPFCKGEPEYHETYSYGAPNGYNLGNEYITIRCTQCHSQLEDVSLPIFRECSNHTVEDFRADPSLRLKVNVVLEQRIADTKSNLLVKWNKRKEN